MLSKKNRRKEAAKSKANFGTKVGHFLRRQEAGAEKCKR